MGVEVIIMGLAFGAAFLAVCSVNMVLIDVHERGRKKRLKVMEERHRAYQKERARESVKSHQDKTLGQLADEAQREQEEAKSLRERIIEILDQSGMRIRASQLIAVTMSAAAVVGLPVGWYFESPLLGIAAALLVAPIPWIYVAVCRYQRLERLRTQLPDSMELMSRVLRAGQTITQAMHAVAQEFKAPIGPEFGYCYEQQNLGLSSEVALRDLTKRTGLLEIKIFVLAILVHRQTGGNLTELLDKLADITRERFRIRGKIKALTAEGRLQAMILLALPPFMYVVLLFLSRSYALQLLDHPKLIFGSLGAMAVGALWIRNIVNFDF